MLLAWQFILVWDIATLTFFVKNHKKHDLLASGLTDFFKKMSKIRKENLSLSRQEVPEIIFGRFLVVVFATRVLQNDMFRQALGIEKDFRRSSIQII